MSTIKVIIDWENNYGAYSDEIPGCVATHKTLDGVKNAYSDALKFHLEGMEDDGDEIPEILKTNTISILNSISGQFFIISMGFLPVPLFPV